MVCCFVGGLTLAGASVRPFASVLRKEPRVYLGCPVTDTNNAHHWS
jgi:hypothetical protein